MVSIALMVVNAVQSLNMLAKPGQLAVPKAPTVTRPVQPKNMNERLVVPKFSAGKDVMPVHPLNAWLVVVAAVKS